MNSKVTNKQILKSPLENIYKFKIALTDSEKVAFQNFVNIQHENLLNTEILVSKRKVVSRKIGQAKKENLNIESLLDEMKILTADINQFQIIDKANDINILSFFLVEKDNEISEEVSSKEVQEKKPNFSIKISKINTPEITQFLTSNTLSTFYHQFSCLELIKKSFGHSTYYYIAVTDDNEVIGVLPLVRLKSLLFGDFLTSMPYFNYGGPLGINPIVESRLMDTANSLASQFKIKYIEYRDNTSRSGYACKMDKANMLLTLSNSPQQVWEKFPSKLRSQVKRAMNEQFRTELGNIELLEDFYQVFSENMRDLGTPVYSKKFFRNILKNYSSQSFIIVIYDNNKPISSAFLIHHKNLLEIPWASTLKKFNHLSPNMMLYWEVIKHAIHLNCKKFDFGRSTIDSGTYRFKKQWGAEPVQSYWNYWLNNNVEMPALNPSNPKFQIAINIWKKLPVFVTKIIGPFIVKNLP